MGVQPTVSMPRERRLGLLAALRETALRWMRSDAPTQSAALAFYTLFSMGPVLLMAVLIAGAAFGKAATRDEIVRQAGLLIGPEAAGVVRQVLVSAAAIELRGLAGLVGAITLLLGATAVFVQLQHALNAVWEVQPRPGHLVRDFLRKRFVSFGLVLVIGFLLLVSLVLSAALAAFGRYLQQAMAIPVRALQTIDLVLFFVLITVLFALIYRLLPDARISWRDVAQGAVATSLVFSIGKFLLGLYLSASDVASVYGVAGSLVLLLLWVYYASMILLLGAGFTRVWSRRYRPHGVIPEPGAARAAKGGTEVSRPGVTGAVVLPPATRSTPGRDCCSTR